MQARSGWRPSGRLLVSPPHHLTNGEILSKQPGPPQFSVCFRQRCVSSVGKFLSGYRRFYFVICSAPGNIVDCRTVMYAAVVVGSVVRGTTILDRRGRRVAIVSAWCTAADPARVGALRSVAKPSTELPGWLERVKAVDWLSMESSVLAAVAYRRDRRQLYLRFHSGDVYRYFEFPPHQYDELLAAESKGRYFAHSIRDKFLYEQVYESPLYGTSTYSSGK